MYSFKEFFKELKKKTKTKLLQIKNFNLQRHAKKNGNLVVLGNPCIIRKNVLLVGDAKIGDYSYINPNTVIGHKVEIGKFCSISYDCHIGLSEHPKDYLSTSPYTYGRNNIFKLIPYWEESSKKTVIGNDVWIGGKAITRQGVKIGDGAIIGGGAVVTKDVAPYSIITGVPGRHLKFRFDKETIESLNKIKWWALSKKEIENYKDVFFAGEEGPEKLKQKLNFSK